LQRELQSPLSGGLHPRRFTIVDVALIAASFAV
jgi:hypothetical protein